MARPMCNNTRVMKAYQKMAESQKTIEEELKKFESVISVVCTMVEESVDKIVHLPNYSKEKTKQTS